MTETDDEAERRLRKVNWVVSLRGSAVASAVLALTCLVALIVVATITKAETLSTVALTLAIIAFVVQIIVFIVQSESATQQMLQAQELFASMQGLLGKIGEQTAGTQATVNKISDRLLETALGKALLEAERSGPDGVRAVDAEAVVADAVRSLPQTTANQRDGSDMDEPLPRWPPPLSREEALRRTAEMSTIPSDETEITRVLDDVEGDPIVPTLIRIYAQDERQAAISGNAGPGLTRSAIDQKLLDLGLLEPVPAPHEELVRLSPRGRFVAAILTGEGEAPPSVAERVRLFRSEANASR